MSAVKMRKPAGQGGLCDDLAGGRLDHTILPDTPSTVLAGRSTMTALRASAPAGFDGTRSWDDRPKREARQREAKPIRFARDRLDQLARIIRYRHGHTIPAHRNRRWDYALVALDALARIRQDDPTEAIARWWDVWCGGDAITTYVVRSLLRFTNARRTWIMDRHAAAGWIDLTTAEWDAIGGLSRFGVCDLEPAAFDAFRAEREKHMARERAARSRARRKILPATTTGRSITNAELAARHGVSERTVTRWREKAALAGVAVEEFAKGQSGKRGRPPKNVHPSKMSPPACGPGKMSTLRCGLGAPPTGGRLPDRNRPCVTPATEAKP